MWAEHLQFTCTEHTVLNTRVQWDIDQSIEKTKRAYDTNLIMAALTSSLHYWYQANSSRKNGLPFACPITTSNRLIVWWDSHVNWCTVHCVHLNLNCIPYSGLDEKIKTPMHYRRRERTREYDKIASECKFLIVCNNASHWSEEIDAMLWFCKIVIIMRTILET